MKNRKQITAAVMAMLMVCTSVTIPSTTLWAANSSKTVESVKLKIDSRDVTKKTKSMYVGDIETIKVKVSPDKAKKTVTFKSGKSSVVSVSQKGRIKAKKAGTAKITVTVKGKDNKKKSSYVKIQVKNRNVTSIKLNVSEKTLLVGKSTTLKATIKPEKATNKKVTWQSDNPLVAKVSSKGKVTALQAGTAVITATSHNKKKAQCIIIVKDSTEITVTAKPTNPPQVTATVAPTKPAEATVTAEPTKAVPTPTTPAEVTEVFSTVAEMKTADLKEGDCVQTKGYYQEGDNGAGIYQIMTYEEWYQKLPEDVLYVRPESELIQTPVDEYGNHTLENGLVAKLLGDNYTPEQWGAKDGANLMPFIHMFAQVKTGRIDFMENKTYELELIAKDNPYRWYMCGGLLGGQYFYKPIMGNVHDLVLDGHNCTITIPDGKFGDSGMGVLNFCRNIKNFEFTNFNLDGKGHTMFWENKNSNHLLFYAPGSSYGKEEYEPAKVENWNIHDNNFHNPGAMYSKAGDFGGDCILVINPDALDGLYINNNEFYNWGRWVFAIDLGGNGERLYNITFNNNKCIGANAYEGENEDGSFKYLNEAPQMVGSEDTWRWRALGLMDFESKKCFTNVEMKNNYIHGTGGWAINGNSKVSENIQIENNYWRHAGGGYPYGFEFYSGFAKDLVVKNNTLLGIGFKLGVFTHNLTFENNTFTSGCRSFGLAGDIVFKGNKKANPDTISTLWSHEANIFYDGEYLSYDEVKDIGVNIVFKDNDAFFNGIFTDMNDLDRYSYMNFDVDTDNTEIWKVGITAFGTSLKINPNAFTNKPQDMYIHGVEITEPFESTSGIGSLIKCKKGQTIITGMEKWGVVGGYFYKNMLGIENFQSYNNYNWSVYADRNNISKISLVCTEDGYLPGCCEYGFRQQATHISYVLEKGLTLQDHAYVYTDDNLYYTEAGGKLTEEPTHTSGTEKYGDTELIYIGKIAKAKLVTE